MNFFESYNDYELSLLMREHLENERDNDGAMNEGDYLFYAYKRFLSIITADYSVFYYMLLSEIANRFRLEHDMKGYWED